MIRGISIRNFTINDLDALARLVSDLEVPKRCGLWSPERVSEILATSMELSLVAVRGKKVVGFLIGDEGRSSKGDRFASLLWYDVIAPLRGRGMEERLLQKFVDTVKKASISEIRFVSSEEGRESENLKKFGFTESERFIEMLYTIQ